MKKITIKEIALIGILIALSIVSRYACASLPNVQPLTAIFILTAAFISVRVSAFTGAGTMLLTGIFLGFGIWVPLQMAAMILIALVTKFLGKNLFVLLAWGAVASYLYGFITGFSMLPYIPNSTYLTVWASGLYFDTLHAVSTVSFILLLYPMFKCLKVKEWMQ